MKTPFDKTNLLESYLWVLLTLGLPLVALIYLDWRAMFATFVLVQSVIAILAIKAADMKDIEE